MSKRRAIGLVLGALCLVVTSILPAVGSTYAEHLILATARISEGDYDGAVAEINSALTRRSDDPLAQLALGIVFLNTLQSAQAEKQFQSALLMSEGQNPIASYGLGICHLSSGRNEAAVKAFRQAGTDAAYDIEPTMSYIAALSGNCYQGESKNPVMQSIAAYGLFKDDKFAESAEILFDICKDWKGFSEDTGPVMFFDPAKPFTFANKKLARPYKTPNEAEPNLKKVSGRVTLRADLENAEGISYVLYFVDDIMVGMVNHHPFECVWDTTLFANTPHSIRIEGRDIAGTILSEQSLRVAVSNSGSSTMGSPKSDDVKQVESRLWELIQIKPSRRLTYYTLAKNLKALKNHASALSYMERTVGINPAFMDSMKILTEWHAPIAPYREIRKGNPNLKLAAITFDDGPNPNTGRLLDILAQKNVKATFFVVGSMAEAHSDMLQRIAADGHEIENHTYSHRNLRYLSDSEIIKELVRTTAIVRDLTGQSSKYFRPPGGNNNSLLNRSAGRLGFSSVFWTINVGNTEGTKPDYILHQVKKELVPGSIILMHNVEEVTLLALPRVIDELRAKGYKLVTLEQLLAAK